MQVFGERPSTPRHEMAQRNLDHKTNQSPGKTRVVLFDWRLQILSLTGRLRSARSLGGHRVKPIFISQSLKPCAGARLQTFGHSDAGKGVTPRRGLKLHQRLRRAVSGTHDGGTYFVLLGSFGMLVKLRWEVGGAFTAGGWPPCGLGRYLNAINAMVFQCPQCNNRIELTIGSLVML
jgi:hypothetical protein